MTRIEFDLARKGYSFEYITENQHFPEEYECSGQCDYKIIEKHIMRDGKCFTLQCQRCGCLHLYKNQSELLEYVEIYDYIDVNVVEVNEVFE